MEEDWITDTIFKLWASPSHIPGKRTGDRGQMGSGNPSVEMMGSWFLFLDSAHKQEKAPLVNNNLHMHRAGEAEILPIKEAKSGNGWKFCPLGKPIFGHVGFSNGPNSSLPEISGWENGAAEKNDGLSPHVPHLYCTGQHTYRNRAELTSHV